MGNVRLEDGQCRWAMSMGNLHTVSSGLPAKPTRLLAVADVSEIERLRMQLDSAHAELAEYEVKLRTAESKKWDIPPPRSECCDLLLGRFRLPSRLRLFLH